MSRRAPLLSRAAALRLMGAAVAAVFMPGRAAGAQERPLRIRKNAKLLSRAEKRSFVEAIKVLKRKPSPWSSDVSLYDEFARWHRDAFEGMPMPGHMGSAFFPWHRMLTMLFEQELQKIAPSLTVPYWDWTVDNTPDAYLWQDDFLGGPGDPADGYAVKTGPFRQGEWEITIFDPDDTQRIPHIVRAIGIDEAASTLPSAADVAEALSIPSYDVPPWDQRSDLGRSLRVYVEGWRDCVEHPTEDEPPCTGHPQMHNRVHNWVGGAFGDPEDPILGTMARGSAPNDPVFWLHHTNIDRLWVEWQRRHGRVYVPVAGGPPGHNLDDPMWPSATLGVDITPRMMLDHHALGYSYDTESTPAPVQLPRSR